MSRYAATLFLSAFLLFSIQPLLGKFSLPWFGGTPSVWTTCMLFFQSVLLAGYFYAHVLTRRVAPSRQVQVHVAVLGVVLVLFLLSIFPGKPPILPAELWRPTNADYPTVKLIGMLLITAAAPLFALSTTAPLLQRWFSFAAPDQSPYRLYAMSNTGSLVALLAYPLLAEPFLSRTVQGVAWSLLFVGFVAAVAWVGRTTQQRAQLSTEPDKATTSRPTFGRIFPWLLLPAGASMLLLASTNQLSQDVAAGPFLWILPLGLYLLTFIFCFEREGWYQRRIFFPLMAVATVGVAYVIFHGPNAPLLVQILAHCSALFFACMIYHGELFRLRPPAEQLSAFYLWISLGGVLGSAFVGLLAPHLFDTYLEYPLALCGALALAAAVTVRDAAPERTVAQIVGRPLGAFAMVLVIGCVVLAVAYRSKTVIEHTRGFFGVVAVQRRAVNAPEETNFTLMHGAISHGYQFVAPHKRALPSAYFTWDTGLGRAIRLLRAQTGDKPLRVAVLGLGIGTTAALLREGDSVRFYEINPDVIAYAAGKGGYFSFLEDSKATHQIALGDARTSLEEELAAGKKQDFDLIVVDVFSGDSIPVHLFTEEAARLFLEHLDEDGMLAIHISNRHVELAPVVASHVAAHSLHGILAGNEENGDTLGSKWAILARPHVPLPATAFDAPTMKTIPILGKGQKVRWTDEKNTLLFVLK